jgi:hypothetical protein
VDEQSSHKIVSIHFKRHQNSARWRRPPISTPVGAIKPKKQFDVNEKKNNVVIILIESPGVVLLIFIALHGQFERDAWAVLRPDVSNCPTPNVCPDKGRTVRDVGV